jgi:hypothetical protein
MANNKVMSGDLRIAESANQSSDPRIVLVRTVNEHEGFAEVLLVHTATELATDRDVVITPETSRVPYSIVVQTDLRSCVLLSQIENRVGHLGNVIMGVVSGWGMSDSLTEEADELFEEGAFYGGTRLAGPLDRRWEFKETEGIALRKLAEGCVETLLEKFV